MQGYITEGIYIPAGAWHDGNRSRNTQWPISFRPEFVEIKESRSVWCHLSSLRPWFSKIQL